MADISTTARLFEVLDGPAAVGRAIGVTTEHAGSLKRRGRIPPRYWPALLVALRGKGHKLTEADLTRIYNGEAAVSSPAPAAASAAS